VRALYGGGSTLRALSRELMSTWAGFAREGRPGAAAGSWPAWDAAAPDARALRILGAERTAAPPPRPEALALHAELEHSEAAA